MAIKSKLQARFCEVLIEQRNLKGWSQEELARRAGIQRTHLSRLETGSKQATLETIERLAIALKLKPENFFLLDAAHA
jgi:transcriptional regulator with XRE-family HTH domain